MSQKENVSEGLLLCDLQQPQPFAAKPLEIVGGSPGLEGAAPQHVCTRSLYRLCDGHDLVFRLHGTGTRDHDEIALAHLNVSDFDDGIVRMEFAVALLERVGNALYAVHDAEGFDQVHVDPGRIAHKAEYGLIITLGNVDRKPLLLEPFHQLVAFFFLYVMF